MEKNKTFEIEVAKKLKITQEDIDDIMCGALEGGINYWCNKAEVVNDYLGKFVSEQISRGGVLRLYDYETKTWHELNLEKFLQGIKKWYADGYDKYDAVQSDGTLDCCNIDALVADWIIQFAVLGEIVYA